METQPCDGSGGKANCHCRPTCPRWTPTTDQIRILKELYYNNGVRSPTAEQIQKISARLRQYGKIEGKNVFYWFQNYKARERLKKKIEAGDSTRPASYTVYSVGQMGDPGYGPVIMEKSFRDCSIASTGSSVVGVSTGSQNFTSSNIFFGQKNPVENNNKEEEEDDGPGIEIETLPLFPMHGEENNSNPNSSSYYSGWYGSSDGSSTTFSSSASLELSLNSYTSRSSAGSL